MLSSGIVSMAFGSVLYLYSTAGGVEKGVYAHVFPVSCFYCRSRRFKLCYCRFIFEADLAPLQEHLLQRQPISDGIAFLGSDIQKIRAVAGLKVSGRHIGAS